MNRYSGVLTISALVAVSSVQAAELKTKSAFPANTAIRAPHADSEQVQQKFRILEESIRSWLTDPDSVPPINKS